MTRLLFGLLLLGVGAAGTGCTMCSHVDDYCPPTVASDGCGTCDPMARANSVLSPPLPLAGDETVVTEGEVYYEMPGY